MKNIEENIYSKLKSYLTSKQELLPNEMVIRETDLDFLADSLKELLQKNDWRKVSEELPSNEYKNEVMPQTLCLTKSKRYGIKLLAYNHSYDVWDNEYLDDYVCDRDDIEEWKPID